MKRFLLFCFSLFATVFSLSGQNAPVISIAAISSAIPGRPVNVPVTVTGFNNIGSVSLTLDYDFSSIQYQSAVINTQLGAAGVFSVNDNVVSATSHRVIIGWYTTTPGITLSDNSVLITLTFNYSSGASTLQWFDNGSSCSYTDAAGAFLTDTPYSNYYKSGTVNGVVTSLQAIHENLITISQDPEGDRLYIRNTGGLTGRINIALVTLRGILIDRIDVRNAGTEEYIIDVTGLTSGIYLLVITTGQGKITKKILRL